MRDIKPAHLEAGFSAAVQSSPLFLPTAEVVRCKAIEHRIAEAKRVEKAEKEKYLLGDGSSEGYTHVPKDNPAHEMAQKWRDESQRLGIGPGDPVPLDVAKRRAEEIVRLVGGCL